MDEAGPISVAAFRKLATRASAEELRRLPIERLPRSIPLDVVDPQVERDKFTALNELAWAVAQRDLAEQSEAADKLAAAKRDALHALEAAHTRDARELERLTDRVEHAWAGSDFRSDPLSEANQELERARSKARDVTEEVGRLHRALGVLEEPIVADSRLRSRISQAVMRAKRALQRLEAVVGRFELLEIDIARGDMERCRQDSEFQLARRRELDEQIRAVEKRLERPVGLLRRLTSPRIASLQRQALEERLDRLMRQRDGFESLVAEDDLMNWLDVLVNASLHVPQEKWRQRAQRTRLLLFRLLNLYCLQQETAAQEVAIGAVPGVNSRQAINYYLDSEQFILSYFARKRKEVTSWLGGAAHEKLERLDRVRAAILADYRRSKHHADAVIEENYSDAAGVASGNSR